MNEFNNDNLNNNEPLNNQNNFAPPNFNQQPQFQNNNNQHGINQGYNNYNPNAQNQPFLNQQPNNQWTNNYQQPYMNQYNYNQGYYNQNDRRGFATASMVLGIISLSLMCLWFFNAPIAIIAIILGICSMKSSAKGMAIAGIVTGAISLFINVIIIFGFIIASFESYILLITNSLF